MYCWYLDNHLHCIAEHPKCNGSCHGYKRYFRVHFSTYSDPDNPDHILGRSEVECRTDYIQPLCEQLGEQHPLLQLICQCLHNIPAYWPSAEELLYQLEAVRPQIERVYGSGQQVKVEMAKLQVAMMSVLRMRETEVGEKEGEIEQLATWPTANTGKDTLHHYVYTSADLEWQPCILYYV